MSPAPAVADERSQREAVTTACLLDESCSRELFLDLVTGDRFNGGGVFRTVAKWPTSFPVVTLLDQAVDSEFETIVEKTIEALTPSLRRAGIEVLDNYIEAYRDTPMIVLRDTHLDQVIESDTDPGLEKLLTDIEKELVRWPHHVACNSGTLIRTGDNVPLMGAVIVRSTASEDNIRFCLTRHILARLGLFPLTSLQGLDSFLSENDSASMNGVAELTRMDELMLVLLYDERVKHGMTRKELRALFPKIYKGFRLEDTFLQDMDKTGLVELVSDRTLTCMASASCALDHFLEMAVTGSSLEPASSQNPAITKRIFPASPRLIFSPEVSEANRQAAKHGFEYMRVIMDIIGAPYVDIVDGSLPDMPVFVVEDAQTARDDILRSWSEGDRVYESYGEIQKLLEGGAACGGRVTTWAKRFGLQTAVAIVPASDEHEPWLVERCVIEEMSQSFGIFFDTDADVETLFDDRADNRRLTAFDLMMFRLLYHPLIEPEMSEADVRAVFAEVHQDVWQRLRADPWWANGLDPEQSLLRVQ